MTVTIQKVLIPTETHYTTVDVQLEADRIEAIAPDLEPLGTLVDGRDKLLLPGFVNAHTHSPELWQRGLIAPCPLELWLAELYDFFPPEPEHLYWSAVGTAVETLLSGGTTVVDHLVLIPGREEEAIAAAIQGYQDVGIRAFVGPLIQDEPLTAGMPSAGVMVDYVSQAPTTDAVLALLEATVERFHRPEAGINIMAAPTGAQLCSDKLLEGCIDLSDRYQLCRHAHLLETRVQKMLAYEKYGCSAVRHLKHLNFLGPRTSLAHSVWVEDEDIPLLAETGATVVHNPLSNLRLGSGIAPILKYRQAGVNVAFGCDGAASNDAQDMLEVLKVGSLLHNVTQPEYRQWISPRQAIAMATVGGATGLGMADQMGTLAVGQKADLVLYDLKALSLLPRTDPLGLLVLGRLVNGVDSAWVDGKPVIAAGQVVTVDITTLKQELFDRSQWQGDRQSPTRQKLEARYRRIMGLSQ